MRWLGVVVVCFAVVASASLASAQELDEDIPLDKYEDSPTSLSDGARSVHQVLKRLHSALQEAKDATVPVDDVATAGHDHDDDEDSTLLEALRGDQKFISLLKRRHGPFHTSHFLAKMFGKYEGVDASLIKRLAKLGLDVNVRASDDGATPLHIAAYNGKTDLIKALIEAGAEPNKLDRSRKRPPMAWAIQQGHKDAVVALMDGGAKHSLEFPSDWLETYISPLTLATMYARENEQGMEIFHFLLSRYANPNRGAKIRPIHFAALFGDHELITALHAHGADLRARGKIRLEGAGFGNAPDPEELGWTPTEYAFKSKAKELLATLLKDSPGEDQ